LEQSIYPFNYICFC